MTRQMREGNPYDALFPLVVASILPFRLIKLSRFAGSKISMDNFRTPGMAGLYSKKSKVHLLDSPWDFFL